jgi:DNA polymerase I-like protein with 3'-5' exonuclease and polymerase domains
MTQSQDGFSVQMSESELLDRIMAVPSGEAISVDVETNGAPRWAGSELRGFSVAAGDWSVYVPVSHPGGGNWSKESAWRVAYRLAGHAGPLLYHHAKGVDWLSLSQLVPEKDWAVNAWDTWVGCWLEAEGLNHGLKERCSLLFGHDAGDEKRHLDRLRRGATLKDLEDEYYNSKQNGYTRKQARALAEQDPRRQPKDWGTFTVADISAYAAKDAELTLRLYHHQQALIADGRPDIGVAMPREMDWQRTVYEMERVGLGVSEARAQVLRARDLARLERLRAVFASQGIDLGANAQGPKVAELVYGTWGHRCRWHTDSGADSTAKEALIELAHDPRVGLILEYRHLAKAIVGYYEPLLTRADPTGRVHPSYGYTRTGRVTAREPNLLTIPRPDNAIAEVREVLVAAEGLELWEYDLAQAEVRKAAALSRDPAMLAILNDPDRDFYSEIAADLDCPRQTAKTVVLARQYGGGPAKLAQVLATEACKRTGKLVLPDVGRARTFVVRLAHMFPTLERAKARYEDIAREEGKIRLYPPGRYRHFRGPGYLDPYKDAWNAGCQGNVGEFIRDVQMQATPLLAGIGGRFVLNVYDSLVAEVPPGTGEVVGVMLQAVVDDVNPFSIVKHMVEAKKWSSPSVVSSPASAASISASSGRASPAPGRSRSTTTADGSSPTTGPTSPATETFETSTGPESPLSTSSPAVSPASPSPPPAARKRKKTSAGSGPNSPVAFATYDPDGRCWRTCPPSSRLAAGERRKRSSGTWPYWGMTRNGVAYQLPPLELLTSGNGSSSLPTPSAVSYGTNKGGSDSSDPRGYSREGKARPSLEHMARHDLWPTPTANDHLNAGYMHRSGRDYPTLPGATGAAPPRGGGASGGKLNPKWVAWLMGFPLDWLEISSELSETPSSPRSPSTSAATSSPADGEQLTLW